MSSTYYGYIFTQLPGSLLVKRVGPKYLFGVPMFITSVFTILTLAAAHHCVEMLILVRILQGLVMVSFVINICIFFPLSLCQECFNSAQKSGLGFSESGSWTIFKTFSPAAVTQVRLPHLVSY